REVAASGKVTGRDRQPVEDVLAAVADDLVDGPKLAGVRRQHLPAALDHEPGDGIAHTVRPPTYQTGPCVETGFVSESARRMLNDPVISRSSRRSMQRLTICGDAP